MSEKSEQKIADRVNNRSHRPNSEEFMRFIGSNWADHGDDLPQVHPGAVYAAARRRQVAEAFAGKLVIIEAGSLKTRSNDSDYRYHPHAAFSHLTAWGSATVPDSVLVIDARDRAGVSTLFFRETAGRNSNEFFANPTIGEFWVGARPTLPQVAALLHLGTKNLTELDEFLSENSNADIVRISEEAGSDEKLLEFASEIRFVKDEWEIAEMRKAVAASVSGFEQVARTMKDAIGHERGERVVETAFYSRARIEGNDLGYDTIAAAGAHACILHWIVNDGPIRGDELLLLDAGVEVEHALLLAKLDQRRRGDLDREIEQEVALPQPVIQHRPDVGLGQTLLDELHAKALRLVLAAAHVVGDDGDLLGLDADVAQDQRQHALTDRAEPHHHQAAVKIEVLLSGGLACSLFRHFSVPVPFVQRQ